MNNTRIILTAGALGLLLAACGGQEPEEATIAPVAEQPAPTAPGAPPSLPDPGAGQTTVIASDSVAVGHVVGADGAVTAGKAAYGTGDTVYASVPVGGYPPSAEVAIYWFGANGTSVKEERKPIAAGARYMSFPLSAADGMTPGRYTVQVDIADMPVGMADFVVQ